MTGSAGILLRLYIAGGSPASLRAQANLSTLRKELPDAFAEIEVVDVLDDPGRCLRDGVTVTPMLVRIQPPPERRLLGDLRDVQQVAAILLAARD
jgi:circadian clock protein KaiB